MAILSSADFPDVRAALDLTLSADDLPDAVIASPVYQGVAENEVATRLLPATYPGTFSSDAQELIRTATILLCAALLAPVVPVLVHEQDGDYRYQRQPVDMAALARVLRSRADALLDMVQRPADLLPERPTFFALAPGGRGGKRAQPPPPLA